MFILFGTPWIKLFFFSNSILFLFHTGVNGQSLRQSWFLSLGFLSPCGGWIHWTNFYGPFFFAWMYSLFEKRRFLFKNSRCSYKPAFQTTSWFTHISEYQWGCKTEEYGARSNFRFTPLLSLNHKQALSSGHFSVAAPPPQVQVGEYVCRYHAKLSANVI